MACVAGVMMSAQKKTLQVDLDWARTAKLPVIVCKHYDHTPTRLCFGSLQQACMPLARYFKYDDASKKWITVPFQQVYAKYNGNVRSAPGVQQQGLTLGLPRPTPTLLPGPARRRLAIGQRGAVEERVRDQPRRSC